MVCCAAAVGGDNLQDLKAGYLVGATPWKQQIMLGIGAFSCALVMAPVLNLLLKAYGIGAPTPEHPNALIAPQATLMASVAKGMFGGDLPWGMISIGAIIGGVLGGGSLGGAGRKIATCTNTTGRPLATCKTRWPITSATTSLLSPHTLTPTR